MEPIIEEIYNKMYKFKIEHQDFDEDGDPVGERYPNLLHLNHDHYCEIMKSKHFMNYVQVDFLTGKPETILGMQYQIKDDLIEMEVH